MAGKPKTHTKRIYEGVVVSEKMDKTIIVKVEKHVMHPIYRKIIKRRKKFAVHDAQNKAKIGDDVRFIESRPYSKTKFFKLLEVVE